MAALTRNAQASRARAAEATAEREHNAGVLAASEAELTQTRARLQAGEAELFNLAGKRALVTAELAGLKVDDVNPLISEWDYGDYEGTTTVEIRQTVPNWLVWTHGCPGGESMQQVSDRADRAIAYALEHMESRDVLFVGHGHFSRAVVTRWVELEISEGVRFAMAAASIAVCGFEHGVRQISALGLTGHGHPCLPA